MARHVAGYSQKTSYTKRKKKGETRKLTENTQPQNGNSGKISPFSIKKRGRGNFFFFFLTFYESEKKGLKRKSFYISFSYTTRSFAKNKFSQHEPQNS